MRRLAAVAVGLGAALAVAAGSAAEDRAVSAAPECQVAIRTGAESHALRFRSRCNFEQTRIRIHPSFQVLGVRHETRLTGAVDPGDTFRCRGDRGANRVRCRGTAGSGASVHGLFETSAFSCEVSSKVRIEGGADCEPGTDCPAVGYLQTVGIERPRDCG
jgi:hypothetical protein